jgi:hypothetical protein
LTASTSTHPQRKQTARPTVWRQLASKYVDLLICGFLAWVASFTFGWRPYWLHLALFLWVAEVFWCRDRLNPTAGEYCLGIRYLTSSSSQVVADIQVIHAKLKLNGALLFAGVVELTLAILCLSGWTLLPNAASFGEALAPPLSLLYWIVAGLSFFLCSGYLLSGSKLALWAVPLIHVLLSGDLFVSRPEWIALLSGGLSSSPALLGVLLRSAHGPSFLLPEIFVSWSLLLVGILIVSRKHLVN